MAVKMAMHGGYAATTAVEFMSCTKLICPPAERLQKFRSAISSAEGRAGPEHQVLLKLIGALVDQA
jgi:hypothetical protein